MKDETLRQALEALKELKAVMPVFPKDADCIVGYKDRYNAAQYQASQSITAIKQALEQPEPEPVATIRTWHENGDRHAELLEWENGLFHLPNGEYKLHTSPQRGEAEAPKRKPLTDEQMAAVIDGCPKSIFNPDGELNYYQLIRATEAAHGIKGKDHG